MGKRALAAFAFCALTATVASSGCFLSSVGEAPSPPPCEQASDCPDDGNLCTTPRCTRKLCGVDAVDDGVASDDVAADCMSSRCESGEHIVESDPTDVDDGIICTIDSCEGGPSHVMQPVDSECSTGNAVGTCTEDGNCFVECSPTQDCMQEDPCTLRKCVDYKCVEEHQREPPPGTEDEPEDCQKPGCVRGMLTPVADDEDLPPEDGDPCTFPACANGSAMYEPEPVETSCGGALVCDGAGTCVECTAATPCPASTEECEEEACVQGACTLTPVAEGQPCLQSMTMVCDETATCVPSCTAPAECGLPSECVGWACTLSHCEPAPVADGQPCLLSPGVCNAGVCAECFVPADCITPPPVCNDWACNAGLCEPAPQMEGMPCGLPMEVCCSDQTCQLPALCPPP